MKNELEQVIKLTLFNADAPSKLFSEVSPKTNIVQKEAIYVN